MEAASQFSLKLFAAALSPVRRIPGLLTGVRQDTGVSTMQTTAWAPSCPTAPPCNRAGCTTRHVFRVASCPHYQFLRALNYQASPVSTRAISEELVQAVNEGNGHMNGASLDHLPDVSPRQQRTETITVHAGERGGRPNVADSLTTPIVQTATFTFKYGPAPCSTVRHKVSSSVVHCLHL